MNWKYFMWQSKKSIIITQNKKIRNIENLWKLKIMMTKKNSKDKRKIIK
jgi:hypothetical protein